MGCKYNGLENQSLWPRPNSFLRKFIYIQFFKEMVGNIIVNIIGHA